MANTITFSKQQKIRLAILFLTFSLILYSLSKVFIHHSSSNINNKPEAITLETWPPPKTQLLPYKRRTNSSNIPLLELSEAFNYQLSQNSSPSLGLLFPCEDFPARTTFLQKRPYWTISNFIKARKYFHCDQSVTYATHSEYTFLLENLVPLLARWKGPISLAVYTPKTDFEEALRRIIYLRECALMEMEQEEDRNLVKDYVSIHIFFEKSYLPSYLSEELAEMILTKEYDCSSALLNEFNDTDNSFRVKKRIPYPINVARNLARESATTKYVLSSDIELYPSPGLIPDFLEMIRRQGKTVGRMVYVLPIFEVDKSIEIEEMPRDKEEMVSMLDAKMAVRFHDKICNYCHKIPMEDKWKKLKVKEGLRVFHVAKRTEKFAHWEPIYIGTKEEPGYDERLSWDGMKDKMTQGYVLCVLGYEMHILDNGFLVHSPGIKTKASVVDDHRRKLINRQNYVISREVLPELKLLYGQRAGCLV